MSGKKTLSLIVSIIFLLTLTLSSCSNGSGNGSQNGMAGEYAENTELRLAIGYSDATSSISFNNEIDDGEITLRDGLNYNAGDLKPVFGSLSEILKIKFTDAYLGYGPDDEINHHAPNLSDVDLIRADYDSLAEAGVRGDLVDLSEYLYLMPNFKSYLEANDSIRMSLLGGAESGAIYAIPSADAVDDLDRALIMRADWVELLLNGEGRFEGDDALLPTPCYRPVMPTYGEVEVDVLVDGVLSSGIVSITKNYTVAGNVIENMNEGYGINPLTATDATNMLRDYIDTAYDGYYGENRADLFIGENAAYDADELVALLRCIRANSEFLTGGTDIAPFFSVSGEGLSDAYALAGMLFGARGLSDANSLYLSSNGQLCDARGSEITYYALENMHRMYLEGLICENIDLCPSDGFMQYTDDFSYLYNMEGKDECTVVIPPVTVWYDGTNNVDGEDHGVYGRFYESFTSVGKYGIAISESGVGKDSDKLYAALALIDYVFSFEGQRIVTYGPDGFSQTVENSEDKGGVRYGFTEDAHAEMEKLGSMNSLEYSRKYLGGCLLFVDGADLTFEGLSDKMQKGRENLIGGIENGTIYRPLTEIVPNMWYFSVPRYMRLTPEQQQLMDVVDGFINSGDYSDKSDNRMLDIIKNGCSTESRNPYFIEKNRFLSEYGGNDRLSILQNAFNRQMDYYLTTRPFET